MKLPVADRIQKTSAARTALMSSILHQAARPSEVADAPSCRCTYEREFSGVERGDYNSHDQHDPDFVPTPKVKRYGLKSPHYHDPHSIYNADGYSGQPFCPDPRQVFGYCPYPMIPPDPRCYIGPDFYGKGMISTPSQQPNISALRKQYAYFVTTEDGKLHPWSEMED